MIDSFNNLNIFCQIKIYSLIHFYFTSYMYVIIKSNLMICAVM